MSQHLPILGSDGTFFKNSGYPDVLLNLVQRDANGRNITIAVTVVPGENQEQYFWLLRQCMVGGVKLADFALFADRGKITNAVRGFRRIGYVMPLKHCTVHLVRNVHSNVGNKGPTLDNAVWQIQGAKTAQAYTAALEELNGWLPEAAQYLKTLKPVKWTVHGNLASSAHPEKRSLFGVRSSNFVESDNAKNVHNGIRSNLPFAALFLVMTDAMTTASARVAEVQAMTATDRKLTPFAAAEYKKQRGMIGDYRYSHEKDKVYTVHRVGRPLIAKRVCLDALSCTCSYRDQMHMPCRHLICVLVNEDRKRLIQCFHPMFLFENYKAAVSGVSYRIPLFDHAIPDPKVLPPLVERRKGKPSTRRIASRGESSKKTTASKPRSRAVVYFDVDVVLDLDVESQDRSTATSPRKNKCGTCGKEGHNSVTCKKRASKLVPATSSGKSYLWPEATTSNAMGIASLLNTPANAPDLSDTDFEETSSSCDDSVCDVPVSVEDVDEDAAADDDAVAEEDIS
ncbi:hypothetical protein ACHHYP_13518 [Achlya hypogyna]|uniref:SWIM-type domain-containing protein n=1 Tax=Achlya hypogyna TaxID=1202772 RepID=A0A1V9YFB9_ACHHY|nr:hypothetical protein ACHHYP_13518 [Achlya hypogyna]